MIAGLTGYLLLNQSLWLGVDMSVATFVVSILLHQRHQTRAWKRAEQQVPVLFPSNVGHTTSCAAEIVQR